ncbi:MAG: hypothetical protein EOO01_20955 [Chitinophagaceae bacterium]|nr:MAG: hypothetical protein EOO01_20955 [Chitinophagaceae bacterium]
MINPRSVPLTPNDLKLIPKWPMFKGGGVVCRPLPVALPALAPPAVAVTAAVQAVKKVPDYSLWIALGAIILIGGIIYFSAQAASNPDEEK